MAWIKTFDDHELADADPTGQLAALYDQGRNKPTGRVDNILKIHGLHPAGLEAHLALYRAVMRGTPGLPTVDREMIALAVSKVNGCLY